MNAMPPPTRALPRCVPPSSSLAAVAAASLLPRRCSRRLPPPSPLQLRVRGPRSRTRPPSSGSTASATTAAVTMQAQREAPPDMQCKDKFLVQSVVAPSYHGRNVYEGVCE